MAKKPKTIKRVTVVCSGNRRTAHIRIDDQHLESVSSKEALIRQLLELHANGRLSEVESHRLLGRIIASKLHFLTVKAAANQRIAKRERKAWDPRWPPMDTLGGRELSRRFGQGVIAPQ